MACDDPAVPYEFMPAGDACDICAAMAGCYAEAPAVPVHANCRCVVAGPGDVCENEVRNIQTIDDSYTVSIPILTYTNCRSPAQPIQFVIPPEELGSSHIEEGMEACAAIGGSVASIPPADAVLPANTTGTVRASVDMLVRECTGELWTVCHRANGESDETYIGDIGSLVETPVAIASVQVTSAAC
jgi:hypothetical protein